MYGLRMIILTIFQQKKVTSNNAIKENYKYTNTKENSIGWSSRPQDS